MQTATIPTTASGLLGEAASITAPDRVGAAPTTPMLSGAAPSDTPASVDDGSAWESDTSAAPDYLAYWPSSSRAPDYVLDEPPPPQPAEPTFTAAEMAAAVATAWRVASAGRAETAAPVLAEPMPAPRPHGCAILLGVVALFLLAAAVLAAQGNPGGALVGALCALLSVALTPKDGLR